MASGGYVEINSVARKIKAGYVGVNGVARKIKGGYTGVNGLARKIWGNPQPFALTAKTIKFPSGGSHYGCGKVGGILLSPAFGTNKLDRSADNGNTWNTITLPVSTNWHDCGNAVSGNNCIIPRPNYYSADAAILRSTNQGSSCATVNSPVAASVWGWTWVGGDNSNFLIIGAVNGELPALYSTNAGVSFASVNIGTMDSSSQVTSLAYCGNGVFLVTQGSGSAIKRSANGGAGWALVTMPASGAWRVMGDSANPTRAAAICAGTDIGAYSVNSGASWTKVTLPMKPNGNVCCIGGNGVFIITNGTQLSKNLDGGKTWFPPLTLPVAMPTYRICGFGNSFLGVNGGDTGVVITL